MERIASAQWLRLQRAIGRAAIRIPPGAAVGRAICSSASSSARRSDAESSTAAAAHSAREARPAGMSAKAWGKQRQRSEAAPAVISELPSPYPESSASHKTFHADVNELAHSAAHDGAESAAACSAQAWLEVLSPSASSSYATSAPYLLSTGAFYTPPLPGPGGRALLARLHSHLVASQIYSVADAELALRVLNRHCVLGITQPDSAAAWPPVIDSGGQASTSASHRSDLDTAANQLQLISTFSRNVDVTLDMVSAALERILRDLGASHLVLDCANLVVRLAVRFQAQIGPASSLQSRDRRRRPRFAAFRRRGSAYNKANSFRQIFHRLAHLIPHRPDRRNVKAAVNLLKSVVLLCNVPFSLSALKDEHVWPTYRRTASTNMSELRATNLPRKRARKQALFHVELCRDVARALLDAPTEDEVRTSQACLDSWCANRDWLPLPRTRPAHAVTLDDHGEVVPSGPLGLRSGKRRSFLTVPLARACIIAISASTAVRKRRWDDVYGEMEIGPGDYDAALRAFVVNRPQDIRGPGADRLIRRFGSMARQTEERAQNWRRRALSTARRRLWETRRHKLLSRSNDARRRAQRAVGLLQWRCRRSFRLTEEEPFPSLFMSLQQARKMVWDHSGHSFRTFLAPWPEFDPLKPAALQDTSDTSTDDLFPGIKSSRMEFGRELVSLFASDPDISENEVLGILGTSHISGASGGGEAGSLWQTRAEKWQDWAEPLRRDAATYESAITGFSSRGRWEASDAVWQTALRRRSSIEGPFDRITRAYLRSKRTSCGQTSLHRRKPLMRRALDGMSSDLLASLQGSPATGSMRGEGRSAGPSVNLSKDLLYYIGRVLRYPRTAFSLWETMLARYPQTASSVKILKQMLRLAESAERQQHLNNSEGMVGRQLMGAFPSFDTGTDTSLGFKIRQIFRRLLFDQHPSLAPWSSNASTQHTMDGVEPVDTVSIFRGLTSSSRRLASINYNFQKEDVAAKLTERTKILTLSLSALSSADAMQSRTFSSATSRAGRVTGAMHYINLDRQVFEAYCSLLHTMTVPDSEVGRPSAARPVQMPEEPLSASSASLWEAAFLGAPDGDDQRTAVASDENTYCHHLDVGGLAPPTWDEVILVLPWMRALNLRPSLSMLCLICVHLIETLPPGSINFDRPLGPIHEWVEDWLGWKALPTEEDVAEWLQAKRRLGMTMEARRM
ncbi:unnamed protein product [Tilletia laevis]|uniref:Uncharacterized protein n=1 Tax=Tilletia laevis TaxID=157183 RepID=A0A9N8M6Q8_9BASI|nr:unnamed protein product [Tilletia laevis]